MPVSVLIRELKASIPFKDTRYFLGSRQECLELGFARHFGRSKLDIRCHRVFISAYHP